MMIVRWLLDSDAATCLCKFELVNDLAEALDVPLQALCVLPQLRYQLHIAKPAKALEKLGSQAAVDHAAHLVNCASEVSVLVSSANQALLAATPDIDGGELALFAALIDSHDCGLVTGDKRALIALSKVDALPAVTMIWARLLCLEEAVSLLIKHFGHAHVSGKIRLRQDANIGLSIAFGRTAASSPESTTEGLNSYIMELTAQTQHLYAPRRM